ncbi:hypothetical protein JN531_012610 [Flagellatimonas centrodinii]|uniref:hypothetical protein n=1 Tax=Flagellatimonas centrodinii TaxID=2806210 RepID=UPI001FEF704C|nr:hypothetical protein [Flagellatimonas centrodinii]ULQ45941.1 hypothetical protein JN531_012610 [Flagellatimonas centrodinii]
MATALPARNRRTRRGHHGPYGRHVGGSGRRWKRGVPCRCAVCKRRRTLRMEPEHYYRQHHAMCCGQLLRIDWYRYTGAEHRATVCHCGAYIGREPYPHRKGSLFCDHGIAARAGFSFADAGHSEYLQWEQQGRPLPAANAPRLEHAA